MLTVYHGSTYRVEQPLAGVCRPNLDFGVRSEEWAFILLI